MKKWQKLGLGLLTVAAVTSLVACGNAGSKVVEMISYTSLMAREKSLTHSKKL